MIVRCPEMYLTIFIILMLSLRSSADDEISVSFDNGDFVVVEAFKEIELNMTITCSTKHGGKMTFMSADESVFTVEENMSTIACSPGDTEANVTYSLWIDGVALGVTDLRTVFQNSTGEYLINAYLVKVLRKPLFTPTALATILLVWICVSYVTMGNKIEPKLILDHLKRPHAVLIGLLCQFLIMPPLSLAIAKMFKLDDAAAIGLILDGTCPGGWFSNVFTLLLDCDFNLSLTMTFCSTVLALGMMPLNLFIYTRFFLDHNQQLRAPYGQLAIQLAFLVVPVVIGLGLSQKFPKVKRIFDKMLRPMLAGLVVVALGVGIPTQYYVVLVSWRIWVASAVFPLIGGLLGFTIARATCVQLQPAVTIAIETGVQNSLLAITVVTLYYDQPEIDLIGRVPALIGLLVVMEGGVLAIFKAIRDFYKTRSEVPHVELDEETGDVEDKGRTVPKPPDINDINLNNREDQQMGQLA
ncbi:ileal sodium/bile acid cotransporter-like [Lytechinus variegatus]|uniref:ileal sodium/bile acid cotransporter-like n=1 Tax=Lytechinus variegatus TaxID=7654 RepID=UPI001BB1F0C2|nr:ileal sodium/bile acid cotransporter-like [Lytechinus variegatus]XP_041460413.1 ileal sodium/bile acid cotransporter-like [Lytechinus variegatus]XP_041460414.1 ileal sodium/bile acid cotransporter-like [Lytechinus variegatus]XP_041460415.1 ileal sodium/bile acid cotransporter-like [Lytechinus variegatus]